MFRSLLIFLSLMSPPDYEIMREETDTAWDVETIFSSFEYAPDVLPEDEWRMPEETYRVKKVDCEDFALFAYDVLGYHDYAVAIYVFESNEIKHAICWYKRGGDEGYFSNQVRYQESDWTPEQYMKEKPEYYSYEIVFSNRAHPKGKFGDFK
jgi:YHS domain-containing protein